MQGQRPDHLFGQIVGFCLIEDDEAPSSGWSATAMDSDKGQGQFPNDISPPQFIRSINAESIDAPNLFERQIQVIYKLGRSHDS